MTFMKIYETKKFHRYQGKYCMIMCVTWLIGCKLIVAASKNLMNFKEKYFICWCGMWKVQNWLNCHKLLRPGESQWVQSIKFLQGYVIMQHLKYLFMIAFARTYIHNYGRDTDRQKTVYSVLMFDGLMTIWIYIWYTQARINDLQQTASEQK